MKTRMLFILLLIIALVPVSSWAGTVTINEPSFRGHRLDWCREWGKHCGRPAADRFCRYIGHERAVRFSPANNIGRRYPTRVINGGRICKKDYCDGFRQIQCRTRASTQSTSRPAKPNPQSLVPARNSVNGGLGSSGGDCGATCDGGLPHRLPRAPGGNELRWFEAYGDLVDGSIHSIAASSGMDGPRLVRDIERSCQRPSLFCHLVAKQRFLGGYLSQ